MLLCFIYFLHFPLSGPVLINISLPIIPCMIMYVTNNKEPWTYKFAWLTVHEHSAQCMLMFYWMCKRNTWKLGHHLLTLCRFKPLLPWKTHLKYYFIKVSQTVMSPGRRSSLSPLEVAISLPLGLISPSFHTPFTKHILSCSLFATHHFPAGLNHCGLYMHLISIPLPG